MDLLSGESLGSSLKFLGTEFPIGTKLQLHVAPCDFNDEGKRCEASLGLMD